MTPHILRNAVFLIFRNPSSIVTQNHTNSYILNIQEFWPPPMLRNLWTIPNHHKQSKIINCNVIRLYLVTFAVILQLKLCLKYFIRNIHGYFWISMDISIIRTKSNGYPWIYPYRALIFSSSGSILIPDSVLETLLVVNYTI